VELPGLKNPRTKPPSLETKVAEGLGFSNAVSNFREYNVEKKQAGIQKHRN